jgi:surfeit locus 1 family protein
MSGAKGAGPRRSWVSLLVPAVLAFALLVGLGTWQLQRKAWKEGLIATLTRRTTAPPIALPARAQWSNPDQSDDEFTHVTFTATFDNADEALVYAVPSAFRSDVSGPGYWVFTPARLTQGGVVLVNRGYVPEARKSPDSRAAGQVAGPITITGIMRWPEVNGLFTPSAEPAHNLWFARDPQAIAAAKGLGAVAPFYVEQEAPTPPGGLPHPSPTEVHLRDAHLQYALTWYGLALVLVVVFGAWVRSSRRAASASDQGPGSA